MGLLTFFFWNLVISNGVCAVVPDQQEVKQCVHRPANTHTHGSKISEMVMIKVMVMNIPDSVQHTHIDNSVCLNW